MDGVAPPWAPFGMRAMGCRRFNLRGWLLTLRGWLLALRGWLLTLRGWLLALRGWLLVQCIYCRFHI
jgi:hypothetical protein